MDENCYSCQIDKLSKQELIALKQLPNKLVPVCDKCEKEILEQEAKNAMHHHG